jgi:hypothetical protein
VYYVITGGQSAEVITVPSGTSTETQEGGIWESLTHEPSSKPNNTPAFPAATSPVLHRNFRDIDRCRAKRSHALFAFASAVLKLFGCLNTPTTGTPSIAVTKSQRIVPRAISGHSATKAFRVASRGNKPWSVDEKGQSESRRVPVCNSCQYW